MKQSGVKGIGKKRRRVEKLDGSEMEMTKVEWNGRRGVEWSGVKRSGNGLLECSVKWRRLEKSREKSGLE